MTIKNVRLKMSTGGPSEVILDGEDIAHALRTFTLSHPGWGHRPTLTVDLILLKAETEAEGEVDVRVPERTHEALVALGWTPPGGAE